MADFEKITTLETTVSLASTGEEKCRCFLIRYKIIKIDADAEVRAEYEAAGEQYEISEDDEQEPDFIPIASISIRELSEDDMAMMSDEPEDNKELGKKVCTLDGWLIMGNLMEHYGYDPHMLCDSFSTETEYVWSALTDGTSAADTFGIVKNVFYAHSIFIEPEYDNAAFKTDYLEGLLGNLVHLINDSLNDAVDQPVEHPRWAYDVEDDHYIDVICYFPAPLPFDNSERQKQMDLACGLVSQIRGRMVERILNPESKKEEPEIEIKVAPEIYMRAAGMRVPGEEPYPESAKNRAEWDLLEAAGWYECSNTRLLYMTQLDK